MYVAVGGSCGTMLTTASGWTNQFHKHRIGFMMNNEDECCSPDTSIGIGMSVYWGIPTVCSAGFYRGDTFVCANAAIFVRSTPTPTPVCSHIQAVASLRPLVYYVSESVLGADKRAGGGVGNVER